MRLLKRRLNTLYPHHGRHISRLLAIKAAIEPTSVEFHIHQVAAVFQVSMARKHSRKKNLLCTIFSARYSSGIKAINIKKVNGDTGQAAHNKTPDKKLRPKAADFFILVMPFCANGA